MVSEPKDTNDPKEEAVATFFLNSDWEFQGASNLKHIPGTDFQKVLRSHALEISLIAVYPFRNSNSKACKITTTWALHIPESSVSN